MSAERIALEAALDYSKILEGELERAEKHMREKEREFNAMRRELNRIRDALNAPENCVKGEAMCN